MNQKLSARNLDINHCTHTHTQTNKYTGGNTSDTYRGGVGHLATSTMSGQSQVFRASLVVLLITTTNKREGDRQKSPSQVNSLISGTPRSHPVSTMKSPYHHPPLPPGRPFVRIFLSILETVAMVFMNPPTANSVLDTRDAVCPYLLPLPLPLPGKKHENKSLQANEMANKNKKP